MRLHVFNPEHDIALAHNDPYFTAPRAGRQLREDCCFLPILWAEETDGVLVGQSLRLSKGCAPSSANNPFAIENKPLGLENYLLEKNNYLLEIEKYLLELRSCHAAFVMPNDLHRLPISEVCPWGWDSALVHQLEKAGVSRSVMPTDESLQAIRRLSCRTFAAEILKQLTAANSLYVGEATAVRSMEELKTLLLRYKSTEQVVAVLKEPWSSSGRGVRYVKRQLSEAQQNWARNVICRQGALMIEPLYNKVADFGMEFESTPQGISYRGLSVFSTINGAYVGNILASEEEKAETLRRFTNHLTEIDDLKAIICKTLSPHLQNIYNGPFGVDMMIVETNGGTRLHPMVEINLRRTMGHVAISLYERGERGRMSIEYANGHYQLRITKK